MNENIIQMMVSVGKRAGCVIDRDIPLDKYTSFKVGGKARIFLETGDYEKIRLHTDICRDNNIPFIIIGGGTNILVSDTGFDGMVIRFYSENDIHLTGDNGITVNAGVSLARTARFAYENALTGMEALAGIPGSVGGAVYMNAGAYGTEIKDVLVSADVIYCDKIITLSNEVLKLSYRESILQENGGIVIKAVFRLKKGDRTEIKNKMDRYAENRKQSQPLDLPSAGSVFKRPQGYFAAKLIEDCGLKGYAIGGARVSEKHAGFIVNTGGARADDIYRLIKHIETVVHNKTGVMLEPEIRFVGEF